MGNHPRRSMVKDWPEYLKKFRNDHDLTQKALADLLAISTRTLEDIEYGRCWPAPYLKRALRDVKRELESKKGD